MENRERIGKEIAAIRKGQGLSQAKLAEMAGVGYGHLARIELGRYNVGIDTLEKILELLGCELTITRKNEGGN